MEDDESNPHRLHEPTERLSDRGGTVQLVHLPGGGISRQQGVAN
jgi:hypothetical protein